MLDPHVLRRALPSRLFYEWMAYYHTRNALEREAVEAIRNSGA